VIDLILSGIGLPFSLSFLSMCCWTLIWGYAARFVLSVVWSELGPVFGMLENFFMTSVTLLRVCFYA